MIKIEKAKDGATLTFGKTKLSYLWNEYSQDDFKKMLDDIRDLLGVPVVIFETVTMPVLVSTTANPPLKLLVAL